MILYILIFIKRIRESFKADLKIGCPNGDPEYYNSTFHLRGNFIFENIIFVFILKEIDTLHISNSAFVIFN